MNYHNFCHNQQLTSKDKNLILKQQAENLFYEWNFKLGGQDILLLGFNMLIFKYFPTGTILKHMETMVYTCG